MENRNEIPVHSAESEISRIFDGLHISTFENTKQLILEKFIKIYKTLPKDSKIRSPQNLISLIIYVYSIIYEIPLEKSDLVALSHISSTDFNDFILQLKNYLIREMGE